MQAKLKSHGKSKANPTFFELEQQILKFGLNSEPTSTNVVAKRLHMKESHKNISMLKDILEKLTREHKVYRCGSRYAIDYQGGKNLMETFCIKISDENYKIKNFVFDHVAQSV
ncbi:hypothetical protein HUU42_00275 [bacterium]|nr:hypothetical protein [bacterium]